MDALDVSKLSKDELRKIRNLVVNELYHMCPEKRDNYNKYQREWRSERMKDDEYRMKHNETTREYLKKSMPRMKSGENDRRN
jgi:predicted methyltransferase